MKGLSPSASIAPQNASASKGFASTGSRMTLSPIFVTLTSLPGNRNSFGSRTAWLRPCMKSLAIALISTPH